MPDHPSNPSADSLENNPFITARNIDDLKDGMRALAITIREQTESNVRFTTSVIQLTAAVDRLERTVREVTTVSLDSTGPIATDTSEEITGVDGVPERRRKTRQTG